jgi:membrane protease YdiL (CAAX protease family)
MLVLYYLLAFAWSWLFLLAEYLSTGGAGTGWPLRFVASLGPLLAALVVTAGYGGRAGLRGLFGQASHSSPELYWYAIALLGYGLVPLGALELHVLLGDPRPAVTADALEFLPLLFPLILLDGPLNEEFGWRGVVLPRLQLHHSALAASVFVGVTWALWHWPLVFFPSTMLYHVPFVLYLVQICALSIIFTWLYNSTGGSLLIAILFHGSVNTWNTLIPSGLPAVAGDHLYLLNVSLVCLAALIVILLVDVRTLTRHRWA